MWVGADSWIDKISEAWPVVTSFAIAISFVINRFSRIKASDKEIVALTKTVETLVRTVATQQETINRIQSNLEHGAQRTTEACRDITDVRSRVDKNTDNISYMLGRMDFGTRQRPDQNPKR